jgi:hypothetical protein
MSLSSSEAFTAGKFILEDSINIVDGITPKKLLKLFAASGKGGSGVKPEKPPNALDIALGGNSEVGGSGEKNSCFMSIRSATKLSSAESKRKKAVFIKSPRKIVKDNIKTRENFLFLISFTNLTAFCKDKSYFYKS